MYNSATVKILNGNKEVTAFKYLLAVPGITKDKVHISYTNDEIEIGIDEHSPSDNNIIIVDNDIEFYGTKMTLNCSGLEVSKAVATVDNGIISLVVPVIEKPKKNIIKIG